MIAGSADGDTIVVRPGVYRENVVVDRPLVIRGERERSSTAVARVGHALVVDAPGVVVEGLTLRGCGLDLENSDAGIRVEQAASGVRLAGNHVIEAAGSASGSMAAKPRRRRATTFEGIEELSQEDRGDCVHLWSAQRDDGARQSPHALPRRHLHGALH